MTIVKLSSLKRSKHQQNILQGYRNTNGLWNIPLQSNTKSEGVLQANQVITHTHQAEFVRFCVLINGSP